ncbi:conserved hypothetical protein [Sphingomonas sp. EC-HK361]|uniref:head-tail connector protein n=1 Tax=Sphingomonas sp. EC-HK361 TaxID=2038397 RepID=UPI001251AE36|nr:hypothetical protein [Sphingomonas sp. EC-HK361]VVT00346.1 conserved hypothetical protein [Sphingomonas sp. EC-HK361]
MSAPPPDSVTIEAIVTAAREQLRMDGTGEQMLLERLAATAVTLAERFTGILLVERAGEDVLPATGSWQRLAGSPVTLIAGMTGLSADGAPFALSPESFGFDIDAGGDGWVRVLEAGAAARVAVAYRAGLAATWEAVPAAIAQATAMLVAHLFEDRSAATLPPAAVAALLRPWRRMALGQAERRA